MINGFINGLETGLSRLPERPFECRYFQSANSYPESTSEMIETELCKGYIIGPYDAITFSQYSINHLGIAVKKYSGKKRLIVDMSPPHDNDIHPSLDELISKEEISLFYFTIRRYN